MSKNTARNIEIELKHEAVSDEFETAWYKTTYNIERVA